MYERGTVTTIDKDIITVICGKPEYCKSCAASKLFCNVQTKEFKALNTNSFDIKTGDDVEIYLTPAKTIGYSFSILIFPLIMFIAGYYLAEKAVNTLSEGIKILGGFAGLIAGFALAFLYNSITKEQKYPVITRKFDTDDAE